MDDIFRCKIRETNDNLKMKAFNGILVLKFGNIADVEGVEGINGSVAVLLLPYRHQRYDRKLLWF